MKKNIEYNNANLVYHVYGEGLPVVLLHGFAETSSIWNNQIKCLSNYSKLIIPDLPGSGESQLQHDSSNNLSIEDFSNAIYSIIQNENIEQCIMLGHSMGGYVALAFAENYPEKLKAFGFVQSTAFADSEEKKQNRLRGIEMIENYGSYTFIKNTTPNLFTQTFKTTHAAKIEQLIEQGKSFSKKLIEE